MEVTLLHYTPIDPIILAASLPYDSCPSNKLVENVWNSGHRSIARHGMASFLIEDVSVSLLTQISRHPHINLTVQSSRYCNMSKRKPAIPSFLKKEDIDDYINDYENIMNIYEAWGTYDYYNIKEKQEISKMFLPKASTVDLVMSGNYQALYEFLQLRNCKRAEWEIRDLSLRITIILKNIIPQIFQYLGCRGDEWGVCPERHGGCGKHPIKAITYEK